MKLQNSYVGGAMNKDIDVRLLAKSFYLDAKNLRINTPDGQNSRSAKFALGNTRKTTLSVGTNPETIGHCVDRFANKIYWAVVSDSGSYVVEYDITGDTDQFILADNRGASTNVLNFQAGGYVEMRILNDNDNGKRFLFLTDGVNEPKYFEIDQAALETINTFTLEAVSLIKAPPLSAPTIVLGATASGLENNIETKFLSFSYRYKYTNGEFSALSPFSLFAFMPSSFSWDYNSGVNNSMFNNFSKVAITFDTGSEYITDVEVIVKESGSNTAYIIDSFNKTNESWADDSSQSIDFSNSKIYRALSSDQLTRVYDNVPIKAGTLELIGNRIVFGNYTEGYNIVDDVDAAIYPAMTLSYAAAAGTEGVPHEQVKSNRDYELAIAYDDGKGRITTPLTSELSATYIPTSKGVNKNTLTVSIATEAPDWATGYRFFIKQSKQAYDTIASIKFYRDGVYAYVKIEANDANKLKEGDFIYVKSDTTGIQSTVIRTKVLEIKDQLRNFLETDTAVITGIPTLQSAGTYFKVKVDGYTLSDTAVSIFDASTYFAYRSSTTPNDILSSSTYVDPIVAYTTGLNDAEESGSYTGLWDIRFEIVVDATGTPDTFKWRTVNVSTDTTGAWNNGYPMTGSPVLMQYGIYVKHTSTTGHTVNDEWVISCKYAGRASEFDGATPPAAGIGYRAIMWFESKPTSDESIRAGASITIYYNDSASVSCTNAGNIVTEELTSTADYANIEEWFYRDNIVTALTYPADSTSVIFRRGTLAKIDGQQLTVNSTGRIYMGISTQAYRATGSGIVRSDTALNITEYDNNIIFETIPEDENSEIFYELPTRYATSGSNHLGNGGTDVNQNFGVTPLSVTLDYFNSFGWYNGFESNRIGDNFNDKMMILDTKPLAPIDNYQEITRIGSLTYSGVYEGTTQVNRVNEFNLATTNYKDMDTKYGSIQKLYSLDTDLLVFQELKTLRVMYSKSVLYTADGQGTLIQSSEVLGQEVGFTGEYGIGLYPESFAIKGNRIYHINGDRSSLLRLSTDGYTEISEVGMKDYFRTLASQTKFVGGYDEYNDEYLINVAPDSSPLTLSFVESIGFPAFYEYQPEGILSVNGRMYSFNAGDIWLHDSNTTRNNFYGVQRTASIQTVLNDVPTDVKHWKSLNIESDIVWSATLVTNFGGGTIASTEFEEKEGEWYAYIRQNETIVPLSDRSMSRYQGLGNIVSINTLTLTMGFELPRNLSIGDVIYEHTAGDTITSRGTVTAYNRTAGTITLDSVASLIATDFIMYGKEVRVEGEAMKGYYLDITLSSATSADNELFAIKAEAVRSSD